MKKKLSLSLFLLIAFLLNFSLLTPSTFADGPYRAFYFCPYANLNSYNHETFVEDFGNLVNHLATYTDINTIVFDMNLKAHKWDLAGFESVVYPSGRGFTTAELKQMASIAGSADMKIGIAFEILCHLENGAFADVYNGNYMLNEGDWEAGKTYSARSGFVEHIGYTWKCRLTHLSNTGIAPTLDPTEDGYDYWGVPVTRSTRDPFNQDGEEAMFNMIYELIDAFTYYDAEQEEYVKPDFFNIACDEAYSWLKVETGALTYAETFAMVVNNAYSYIHDEIDSNIDVMMFGDMLDPITNGYDYQTSDAVDYINKNIIISDWRYNLSWYRYDFHTGLFPSVQEYVDAGFKVVTASWKEVEPTTELIWTANTAAMNGGTMLGHFYTTWSPYIVPYVTWALEDPDDTRLDTLNSYDGSHEAGYTKNLVVGIANSINATAAKNNTIIGLLQCSQSDTSWSSTGYPTCENANDQDGFYNGVEYRDYYYDSGVTYNTIKLPVDAVSYWDFEGNANDRMGTNDGILCGNAAIVTDSVRGQVVEFDGWGDYVFVADDDSLDVTSALSISLWFKTDEVIEYSTNRVTLVSKDIDEYELMLYDRGKLLTMSSNGVPYGYEIGISSFRPDERVWDTSKWYHAAWVMDGDTEYMYLNGELIGKENRKSYNGTLGGADNFYLGRRPGSTYYFDGRMDDVMFFDRVLDSKEVKRIYLSQNIPEPISSWDFEGDSPDDKVGSNDGTLVGNACIYEDAGRYNEYMLWLDGTGDCVTCGDPADLRLTGSRTISCWIRPDCTKTTYMMIAGRNLWGYSLSVLNGRLRAYVNGSTVDASSLSTSAVITTGEWQHIAMTFDIDGDKKIHLYRNGAEVDCSTQVAMDGTPTYSSNQDFTIGANYNYTDYCFDGRIDNVKVFDSSLSSDQIAIQYQLGMHDDLFEQGLVEESICLDVDLDETTGTTVYDDSAEGNDGTICGSNWGRVSGISGYCLDFYLNGADSYVSFGTPDSLELSGSRSISAWVKPDTFSNQYNVIAAKYVWGFSIFTNSTGKLKGYVAGTSGSASSESDTALSTSEWQHVAMTFDINGDDKTVHLYVNGVEVSYAAAPSALSGSPVNNSDKRFTIGADYCSRFFFDGKIDQVKVFSRALTPRQVMYYYLNSDI